MGRNGTGVRGIGIIQDMVGEKGRLSIMGLIRGTGKGYHNGPHPGAWWAGLYWDVMGLVGTGMTGDLEELYFF